MSNKYITVYDKIIFLLYFLHILQAAVVSFTKDHLFPLLNWGFLHFFKQSIKQTPV